MRCLTLADELRNRHANCIFICKNQPGDLNFHIKQRGYDVKELNNPTTPIHNITDNKLEILDDMRQTLSAIGSQKVNWLIVDHYNLSKDWEHGMRGICDQIMVIDDLANRPHDCDILLDQNLRENALQRYKSLVPAHCRILTGPQHVLLNPQHKQEPLRTRDGIVRRILVYMGGNDNTNQTTKALQALKHIPNIQTIVILGFSHPHRNVVYDTARGHPCIQVMDICDNMAQQMNLADLALGTCGISAWERCAMGLPTLVTVNAENQREDALALHKLGAIEYLGDAETLQAEDWLFSIQRHILSPDKVINMSEISKTIVRNHQDNFSRLINQIFNQNVH